MRYDMQIHMLYQISIICQKVERLIPPVESKTRTSLRRDGAGHCARHTPNLPTKIIHAKIRLTQTFREILYGHENYTPLNQVRA